MEQTELGRKKREGEKYCMECAEAINQKAIICPKCGCPQENHQQTNIQVGDKKSRTVAILLALFLGGLGLHKFYLGKIGHGVLYALFCWTFIPVIIAFFEMLGLLFMSDKDFNALYNGVTVHQTQHHSQPLSQPQQLNMSKSGSPKKKTSPFVWVILAIMVIGFLGNLLPEPDSGYGVVTNAKPNPNLVKKYATDSFICKAATAEQMGRKVKTMSSTKTGTKYHITYPRPDNGLTTGVYCWVQGNKILWQTDGMDYTYKGTSNFTGKAGRVRNGEYDEKISFSSDPTRLTINILYSDNSKTSQVYKIPKPEQLN